MAEHTLKFPLGTWVKGKTTDSDSFEHGLLVGMDEGDGEHRIRMFPPSTEDWASFYQNDLDGPFWSEPGDLTKDEPPEWLGGHASHAFVYDWMDDHVPNVSLHAEPSDLLNAYFTDADEGERAALQTKLMEAVVDPGARIPLGPDVGVRFLVVNG